RTCDYWSSGILYRHSLSTCFYVSTGVNCGPDSGQRVIIITTSICSCVCISNICYYICAVIGSCGCSRVCRKCTCFAVYCCVCWTCDYWSCSILYRYCLCTCFYVSTRVNCCPDSG